MEAPISRTVDHHARQIGEFYFGTFGENQIGIDSPAHNLAKMIADPSLVDLDDLSHRLLVTHRLLLHFRRSRQT